MEINLNKIKPLPASPKGTIRFIFTSGEINKREKSSEIIFQKGFGAHVIRITKENEFICYYHWSPGTGSRLARVNLNDTSSASSLHFLLSWHPKKTALAVAPVGVRGAPELIKEGLPTNKSFRLAKNGEIFQVGDEFADILELRVEIDGIPMILPTAKESWRATTIVCDVLKKAKSKDANMFEMVKNHSILTTLVTGFETYCKKRLIELEGEGISPDLEKLSKVIQLTSESGVSIIEESKTEAKQKGMSILELWLLEQRRVNFQEFEKAKKAFNRAYGIKFGEIGVKSDEIKSLKMLFEHRHRIIHVSPLLPLLINKNPKTGNALLLQAESIFNTFVERLHEATLQLGVQAQDSK